MQHRRTSQFFSEMSKSGKMRENRAVRIILDDGQLREWQRAQHCVYSVALHWLTLGRARHAWAQGQAGTCLVLPYDANCPRFGAGELGRVTSHGKRGVATPKLTPFWDRPCATGETQVRSHCE